MLETASGFFLFRVQSVPGVFMQKGYAEKRIPFQFFSARHMP